MRQFTVHHDGVTIPVSRGGAGRPLVLCPGLNATQADLRELATLLRRDHDVLTLDLRGHGLASAAGDYSFAGFLDDLAAVLAEVEKPVLVGYSLGADLAAHYAAEHPGAVERLVLVDGAIPVPEPFLTEADLPLFRGMWDEMATEQRARRDTARRVVLTGPEILGLNLEIDAVRSRILGRYREIDRPVSLIASTSMAGAGDDELVVRVNRNWRAGVERLRREQPEVVTSWVEADHGLVFTHATEVARLIAA
ncbi:alpha/beta hydrolase [Amycolatopsis sp. OK19-0408]|uniref:Alpha/beta hydrolase n=1 Tax=Amycolatopsis iheyensis TaxID=2945988 RepID=A0A9X2SNT2_9PSEU|nr:alpha/beta hydrolase [Amycolatopsis iheyensis]MCR6486715.1 alpha/beta hydrolase [Amycolatopsis iheyensis]